MVRGGFCFESYGAVFRKTTGQLDSAKPEHAVLRDCEPLGVNS
jgi:hypothetical protein